MADQSKPVPSENDPQNKQPSPQPQPPEGSEGWHEPPVDEGSSRPVPVESWYKPENAVPEETAPPAAPSESAPEELPGATPEQAGAWYTPIDAQLDALLSGAANTIAEVYKPEPAAPVAEDTQALAGTQAQPSTPAVETPAQPAASTPQAGQAGQAGQPPPGEDQAETRILTASETPPQPAMQEPAASADSTPVPEQTPPQPVSPGLSPAEAAMLAEQRAAEPPAGEPTPAQPAPPAQPSPQATAPQRPAAGAAPAAQPTPYEQVERKVQGLRERYNAGYLTREQLQAELRSLMILGEDGHWWMLGLESNRWYSYDGRDWKEGTPPGYREPVRGSAVPTETGMQEVVTPAPDTGTEEGHFVPIEIDEDGMPLPRRVPQVDPGATLVSPSTPFMEPMRPSEAPTQSKSRQVEADSAGLVAAPMRGADQPGQPARPSGEPAGEPTIRSTLAAEPTAARGIPVPPRAEGTPGGQQPPQAGAKPRYRIGEFPQPDYREALGRDRRTLTRRVTYLIVFGVIGAMALTLLLLLALIGYYVYEVGQYSSAVDNLRARTSNFETTLILDANGTTLAEFSDPNTGPRQEVPLEKISPWLIDATVATENETFYTDPGFSVLAIVRAAYQNLQAGSTVSGASTITQQLARALILETQFASQRTTQRKLVEIIVASEIKRKYTKNDILDIYLNEIFYGNRAYGAEAAAQIYFHKSASDLNPAEAAFLAGLPQSPATYDPVVNREAALQRMHTVLRLMSEANNSGCIYIQHNDQTQWAVPAGGGLCVTAQPQPDGSTVYYYQTPNMEAPQEMTVEIAEVETAPFKPPATQFIHPHFVNYVWQQLEDTYGSQRIYSAGFRVTTTLDENIQKSAEDAVTSELTDLQSRGVDATNASVVVMRPSDGAVLAMVGSADYYNDSIDGQVNVAFTGQQPGSSIKPFVYLTAFEPDAQGRYFTPATVLWDVYTEYPDPSGGPPYVPENYDGLYHGPETVRLALGNSLNVPAVKTMDFATVERFTELAKRVGLRFPLGDPVERNAGLTTALGAVEVRLFDMVTGYAVLANNGRRVDPYSILHIEDSKGNEIYQANPSPEGLQVVSPDYAYLITSILSDNDARAAEFGYGWPLELQGGRIAAVKTGTSGTSSSDVRDIWTLGYTPQFVVGVWVGNSDNRPMYGITGYGGAAPIWNQVMEAAHAGLPVAQFPQPSGLVQIEVCNDSGAQASGQCAGRTHWDIFASSAPPPGPDQDILRTLQVDGFTGKLVNQSCQDDIQTRTFVVIDDPTAYNWINTTPDGNAWARDRGLEPPVMPPPTESCDPNEPRPVVIVSFPTENMTVEGVLPLRGTVTMPNFSRFEIRYGVGQDPTTFSGPLDVKTDQYPEAESLLWNFDTRSLQNGLYTLRLVAIDVYGRSVVRDVLINVNNPQQPTPVPAFATPTLAPSLTPAVPFATQPPGGFLPSPTLAPTLTPTWTLTPTPFGQ
jgi:membrane peptidoglycan carboxypeptidase